MRIAIIDYGAGNLQSVANMVYAVGGDPEVVTDPEAVRTADRLVLPGVGAAGPSLETLRRAGMDQALDEAVRRRGHPMLGICLGMQLLADQLTEFGDHRGLGWIAGTVVQIETLSDSAPAPHMGWNQVRPRNGAAGFFESAAVRREFYFAHSFTLRPAADAVIAATVDYGTELVAAVRFDSVFATQFHPEKSQVQGERLIEAFLEWSP